MILTQRRKGAKTPDETNFKNWPVNFWWGEATDELAREDARPTAVQID
jgi:hypothetical protein